MNKILFIEEKVILNLQLDGFVPVDDVTRELKSIDINHMDISTLRPNINPLTLERQDQAGDPGNWIASNSDY